MIDPIEFGKQMGALIREEMNPLLLRIAELEARQLERGDPGPQGERGEDGRSPDASEVALAIVGSEGFRAAIDHAVAMHLSENPAPAGRDGEPGQPGADGQSLAVIDVALAAVDTEGFRAAVDLAVAAYLQENPLKDGRDGDPGPAGEKGEPGKDGQSGADGRDGIGLADALIDRDGALVLTMTDGRAKSLGVIVGRDGASGADGRDGLSMADVTREYDSQAHEVVERWSVAGAPKELRYPAGGIRPGGFWREGMKCHALQAITHDGALWIAKRDNASKPCTENAEDWQLAARKGRDGRDGKDGKPPPGPVKLGGGDA